MLRVAAEYIREHCPDQTIHFDDTECDGYCVADDCECAAEDWPVMNVIKKDE